MQQLAARQRRGEVKAVGSGHPIRGVLQCPQVIVLMQRTDLDLIDEYVQAATSLWRKLLRSFSY